MRPTAQPNGTVVLKYIVCSPIQHTRAHRFEHIGRHLLFSQTNCKRNLLSLLEVHTFPGQDYQQEGKLIFRMVSLQKIRRGEFSFWSMSAFPSVFQKIHRALNMTYEDVKRQRANSEKSCNIQKAQPSPPAPPAPPTGGATSTTTTITSTSATKWNNEYSKALREPKDNKRVHFNLETLNTRRLQAQAMPEVRGTGGTSRGTLTLPVCENGGPGLSLLPPSASSSSGPLPQDDELQQLQERIEEMRGQLKAALARRAELQTSLAQGRVAQAAAVTQTPPARLLAMRAPPTKENGKR